MARLKERDRRCIAYLSAALLPSGHGLPGAEDVDVAGELESRMATWRPRVRAGLVSLVRAWDAGPIASRHRKRFSSLPAEQREDWLESAHRSKYTWRRLHVAALKQLLVLVWASTPEVEDALGYDYTCRLDGEVHGAARSIAASAVRVVDEPADYHRPGAALASGAIPVSALTRGWEARPRDLTTLHYPDLQPGARLSADVIVVGSGAGGAVVAATLAEAGVDVIVVEEGPHVTAQRDFVGPVLDRFQRFCRDNGTTQVWGLPPIPLPLGRVVGGTTVVNSGTCFRAPERVLGRWVEEFGMHSAASEELVPHYENIEAFLNVRPVPWHLLGPNGEIAHRGATALGMTGGPLLRNIADCHGCGQCAFGCPTDAKQAMHITYLPRAQHAGALVISGCRVERVEHENERATGVSCVLLDSSDHVVGPLRIEADHVVVCAGAIHTPALLTRSRVPDPSGTTGRNLRIHPATGVGGSFDDVVDNWKGTLQSYYIDSIFESHEIMFEATTTIPGVGAGSLPGVGERAMSELGSIRNLATLGFYVSDTSKGRVRVLHNGEAVPTYRMNDLDAMRMAEGLATAAEVLLAAGARRVYVGLPGLDSISASEDLEQLRGRRVRPRDLRLTAFHPMGTVRMGGDPARSAVDPDGRHHRLKNMWVADASTFPTCVGVNPQMTIMALAKRTAEQLASKGF